MIYTAVVRRKNGATVTMKPFSAEGAVHAAEMVRANHGFDTDDPHRGFVIKEVRILPTSTIKAG